MTDEVLNATLIERHDLNEELAVVRIRPDWGEVDAFKPGQFAMLGFPREEAPGPVGKIKFIRRAYSIASSPKVRDHIELFVVLVEEGKLTPRLWTVPEGGRLWLDNRIKGEFTLDDVPNDKDLVLVSTGTGIAPFVSMLRTYHGENRWRKLVMINGVRRVRDLGYREELERIAAEDPSVVYIPLVTREPEDSHWAGLRGRVQAVLSNEGLYQELTGSRLDPEQCHVMLCGNPAMITGVEKDLHVRGFTTKTKKEPGNIHFERYW